ncbi:MAG TPA: MipA/OmpV family protein [Sphingomonas sp.]|nr:MipA/OmpV family protein [Sphingomonas sp.]
MPHHRLALVLACLVASPLAAQTGQPPGGAPPGMAPDAPAGDWAVEVGVGTFYAPAFLGSDDYQLFGGPTVSVRYKDRVFVSADGIGADLVRSSAWRLGPILKVQLPRRETNGNALRLAGARSDALRGLGDVGTTPELGGYVEYRWRALLARAELRQGIGGHEGAIGDLSLRTLLPLAAPTPGRLPLALALGVRASVVDARYNAAYFGIGAAQSAASGLARYDAGGGLLSAGTNAAVIVPLSPRLTASVLAGYDRLTGDAARSPLVEERGTRDQLSVGLGFTFRLGR